MHPKGGPEIGLSQGAATRRGLGILHMFLSVFQRIMRRNMFQLTLNPKTLNPKILNPKPLLGFSGLSRANLEEGAGLFLHTSLLAPKANVGLGFRVAGRLRLLGFRFFRVTYWDVLPYTSSPLSGLSYPLWQTSQVTYNFPAQERVIRASGV